MPSLGVLGNSHMYLRFFCQIAPYAACFWMGAIVARNGLFDRLHNSAKQHGLLNPLADIAIWCMIIVMRQNEIGDIFDVFFIPVLTVVAMDFLSHVRLLKKGFWYLGRQSTFMWLIHPFFCYYFGVPAMIVAYPRYAIPSLLVLIVMTYFASVLLEYFWKGFGFVYRKANSVNIHFKHFGASGEKR